MTYPIYNFTGTGQGVDPNANAGMQQYLQQGQLGIDPGQAQIAASSPVSTAGQMNLAKSLMLAGQANTQSQAGQDAMTAGANMQPNVNGQNMGGVGPTVNNANSIPSFMSNAQSPTLAQQIGNYLSNWGSSGGDNGGQ